MIYAIHYRSAINWRFEVWLMTSLQNNTYQMQENKNNSFGSKKWNTTLRRENAILRSLLFFGTHVYLFSYDEGSCYFQPETITSVLQSIVLFWKLVTNHPELHIVFSIVDIFESLQVQVVLLFIRCILIITYLCIYLSISLHMCTYTLLWTLVFKFI